jgi:hypothetical protein
MKRFPTHSQYLGNVKQIEGRSKKETGLAALMATHSCIEERKSFFVTRSNRW